MFKRKNKEETITNFYEKCFEDFQNKTHNTIISLNEQNKDLQQRIDKAIEYIKENNHLNWYKDSCYTNDLLEILGGDVDE